MSRFQCGCGGGEGIKNMSRSASITKLCRRIGSRVSTKLRLALERAYEHYFEENVNNSKETWRGINDIISRKVKSDK